MFMTHLMPIAMYASKFILLYFFKYNFLILRLLIIFKILNRSMPGKHICIILIFLFSFAVIYAQTQTFIFDRTAKNKRDQILGNTTCNKDTTIDLFFNANNVLSGCTPACSITNNISSNKMVFLNARGQNLTYTLQSMLYTNQPSVSYTGINGITSYLFNFNSGSQTVIVEIPILLTANKNFNENRFLIAQNATGLTSFVRAIKAGGSISLDTFNFLNMNQYGHFYTVSTTGKTLLTNAWVYVIDASSTLNFSPTSRVEFFRTTQFNSSSIASSGDLLCYGSLINMGLFQTHIRQSYPLWTAWLGILFYWIYLMVTEVDSINCYDKYFENNKLTNWGFYSLHFLGNDQYFSKTLRTTMLLNKFSVQGLILGALYGTIGLNYDAAMIIWSAVIAYACTIIIPFAMGGTFIRRTYNLTADKYAIQKKIKEHVNAVDKSQVIKFEEQVINIEEQIYSVTYWYYVLSFAIFITCWIVAVHLMIGLPRQFYNRHYYWLASLAITFFFDNLIAEPILAAIFGGFEFYQIRGYYYDFRLGDMYKAVNN